MGTVEKVFCSFLNPFLAFIESTCLSSIFWVKLDKSFLQKKFFKIEVIDPSGVPFLVDQMLGALCGYTLSKDVWGNPIFRASFLGCHVINEKDEKFSLTVNIKVSSFEDLRAATDYQHPMHCYFSWAPREILCEENYMEVSVKTDVPGISDAEWMSALPEAQKVMYQMWNLMFYSSSGVKTTGVRDADKLGYSFNNTLARVFLRSPYSTNETQNTVSTVSNGVYGVTYSIDLLIEHSWTDRDWQLTKYLVIKPITIPFLPRIPIVINNTVPETRIFDVFLGVFLPDVNLVTLTIGDMTYSLKEAEEKGYRISVISFPNGTRGFELEVPFDDPNVLKEYMNINETRYHLRVIYTLTVGPEEKLYHHPADVECIMADVPCYPNGTVTVLAHMKTVPSTDMGKTRLKDKICKPREYTKNQALFQFQVSTCGTSLMFTDEHLIYENEISFETLPIQNRPIITRDPGYRLTILCYYPIKETLMQSAVFYGSSSRTLPFGFGTMMSWPNSEDQISEIYPNHHGYVVTGPVFIRQPEQFKELNITRNKVGFGAENIIKIEVNASGIKTAGLLDYHH
ncbi:Zona pellucida sperm-binding protein 2, partial [Ophiophagus hannah]